MKLKDFAAKYLDRMYTDGLTEEQQCTGYLQLKEMIVKGITPATKEETSRWEKLPTLEELASEPDIKYLRFLHPLMRDYVRENWGIIKRLET